jgi:hypothetical protein
VRTRAGASVNGREFHCQDFFALWKDADPDIPILIVTENDRFLLDS